VSRAKRCDPIKGFGFRNCAGRLDLPLNALPANPSRLRISMRSAFTI
jgi:hypothetical protein